jgi:hypothetical protein
LVDSGSTTRCLLAMVTRNRSLRSRVVTVNERERSLLSLKRLRLG